jgi:hypothetical protein
MAVVTGFDDPITVLLSDDLTDMVRPNDDRADASRSRLAPMRPIARQIKLWTRITADELPHLPTAPR